MISKLFLFLLIELLWIIQKMVGEGAWGVVRKGTLRIGGKTVPVAVKTIPNASQ